MSDNPAQGAQSCGDLPSLWKTIVSATQGDDLFWIGEALLDTIHRETGYHPSGLASPHPRQAGGDDAGRQLPVVSAEDIWSEFVGLCEAIEEERDGDTEAAKHYQRGRRHAAKSIRRAVEHPKYRRSPAAPALTIDDVPSCGQENDYRRAHSPAESITAAEIWSEFVGLCEALESEGEIEMQSNVDSVSHFGRGKKTAAKAIRRSVVHPKYRARALSREGHDPDAGLPTAADVRGILSSTESAASPSPQEQREAE